MAGRKVRSTPASSAKAKQGGAGHTQTPRKSSAPSTRSSVPRGARQAGRQRTQAFLPAASLPLLRNSERSQMKRCEFAWDLIYNLQLKPETETPALRFGSLVHKSLADWYIPGVKRGKHPATAFAKHYKAELERNEEIFGIHVEDERWVNAQELGVAMLEAYVEEYGQDEDWEVLATEQPFHTLVTYPEDVYPEFSVDGKRHRKGSPWFYYVGVMDGIWRYRPTKEFWLPEHKTTDGIGEKKWAHLVLDDQAGGYWSFGVDWIREQGLLKPNQQLHGMLYNLLRKALPDERPSKIVDGQRMFLNLDGTVSKRQPTKAFERLRIFRDEFDKQLARERAMIDFGRAERFRLGKLAMTKNPGMFTCPMCAMRDACELHETGADWESFLKQTTKKWEPYSEHEIYDGR